MNLPRSISKPGSRLAFTRAVSPTIVECELTHLARAPIDPVRAAAQHATYETLLEALGCTILRVAPAPLLPDAVFVEDTAIVLPEFAVITHPGARSRRPETADVAQALAGHITVRHLVDDAASDATLDGGDVLRIGHTLYVGGSARSNDAGRAALKALLAPYGYEVVRVDMTDCLHLKTAVTTIADDAILVNPAWVDARNFDVAYVIEVDATEPFASNILRIGNALVHDAAHARTRARLRAAGFDVHTVDASELAKAEGGVTCCSLIVDR